MTLCKESLGQKDRSTWPEQSNVQDESARKSYCAQQLWTSSSILARQLSFPPHALRAGLCPCQAIKAGDALRPHKKSVSERAPP